MKSFILTLLKIFIAALLIGYLLQSGQLDFRSFNMFLESPLLLLAVVVGWIVVVLGLGSLRWWFLLRGVGIDTDYLRVVQLNMVGLFFNSTIPGAVGGDIIKAVYVMRDQKAQTKTPSMLTIVLDRVVGLIALFVIAGVAVSFEFRRLVAMPALVPLIVFIYAICFCSLCLFLILFSRETWIERRIAAFFAPYESGVMKIPKSIFESLLVYKERPASLVAALLISIVLQSAVMFFFLYLSARLNGVVPELSTFAAIYPIGILVTALPLAPAGVGVGHVAFDQLYKLVGMENGANVFNLYVLLQIVFNLAGVIPYLFMKRGDLAKVELAPQSESC